MALVQWPQCCWLRLLLLLVALCCRVRVHGFGPSNNNVRRQHTLPLTSRHHHDTTSITTTTTTTTSLHMGGLTDDDADTTTRLSCDVAVLGAGFGGLYTALAISREAKAAQRRRRRLRNSSKMMKKANNNNDDDKEIDIVLVDPSDRFVFLPLLYDLTMGTATETEVCPLYDNLLAGTGIRHVRATFESLAGSSSENDDDLGGVANIRPITPGRRKHDNNNDDDCSSQLSFRAAVIAVGATPNNVLATTPGAATYAQPFYTRQHAKETAELLRRLEARTSSSTTTTPRIAIVGGGYGGVELAACVKRRIPQSCVTLLTRGTMKGTRAEPFIDQALERLGVVVELCAVNALRPSPQNDDTPSRPQIIVKRTPLGSDETTTDPTEDDDKPWDAVLWTAGSGPASPVSSSEEDGANVLDGLTRVGSGRLAIDGTLRCLNNDDDKRATISTPAVWALGDCAEIVDDDSSGKKQPAVPKTAQAAIQQADVVASNVLSYLDNDNNRPPKTFQFQDLGTVLSLGGPNGAILGPGEDSALGPLATPLLDGARIGLGLADEVLKQVINKSSSTTSAPSKETTGKLTPRMIEDLGLSLSGYGLLGAEEDVEGSGTLAGTLSGAARRAIYAARMPTNRQRAYAAVSAAFSTVTALAKEVSDQIDKENEERH